MILPQVKAYTSGLHEGLEERVGGHLFTGELTPEHYFRVLKAFYSAYSRLEYQLSRIEITSGLLINRRKTHWIVSDLEECGAAAGHPGSDHIPVPVPASAGFALGMMYVMEGATLGGKYIAHQLDKYAWISPDKNLRFFTSYGEERGAMWKEFTGFVETYAAEHAEEEEEILNGAEATFRFMDQVMAQLQGV